MYLFLILGAWLTMRLFVKNHAVAVSVVLQVHALFTFFIMHWVKGAPRDGPEISEKFENLTFWEQIDNGELGTPDRRFLSVVPVLLFFVSVLFIDEEHNALLFANLVATLFVVIPKFHALFGVRLFGVNRE